MIRKNIRNPIKIIPVASKWITTAIIIGLIVILIIGKLQQKENTRQGKIDCNAELKREVSGTVARAFFDTDINRKAFVIEFTNGKDYVFPIYLKDLNGYVDKGDSVYKKGGTFKFIIFRKERYENPIIIVEDTVNCDTFYNK